MGVGHRERTGRAIGGLPGGDRLTSIAPPALPASPPLHLYFAAASPLPDLCFKFPYTSPARCLPSAPCCSSDYLYVGAADLCFTSPLLCLCPPPLPPLLRLCVTAACLHLAATSPRVRLYATCTLSLLSWGGGRATPSWPEARAPPQFTSPLLLHMCHGLATFTSTLPRLRHHFASA